MIVGLLGDTHDRLPAIAELVRRMQEAGAGMILHVGDYSSPFSLAPIIDANVPLAGVFGRNDGDREGLRAYAAKGMGTELYESPHSVDVAGQRILLVHDVGEVGRLSVHNHSIIVHGCSHVQEMKTRGEALMVNPGEGCGWLYGAPSAAVLDLETKRVEFIKLDPHDWPR
jgi:putative phosphoesterase